MLEYRVIKFSKDEITSSIIAAKGSKRFTKDDIEEISLIDSEYDRMEMEGISIRLRLNIDGKSTVDSIDEATLIRALIGFLKSNKVPIPMRSTKTLLTLPGGFIGLKIHYSEKGN